MEQIRVIISGGGTGGHIYPAISIANEIRRKYPQADILFVGAENRMEMEKVPAAGYRIVGLPVAGFERKRWWKNADVLIRLNRSLNLARKTVKEFNPHIAIGVGGYASGPTLRIAGKLHIPTLLQEQNSYAGLTNKLLARRAEKICVAYEGMERFFPAEKIVLTGNPVRQDLMSCTTSREDACSHFGLDREKKTILLIGGSLGARTLNQSIIRFLDKISRQAGLQFIWQSGKYYYQSSRQELEKYPGAPVCLMEFISRMDLAYSAADLIVSRAGAGSISEFCLVGKPVLLVPSPNVAEDHQTQNALALVQKGAAVMIADKEAEEKLIPEIMALIGREDELDRLGRNIKEMALPDAAAKIVEVIEKILQERWKI